MVNKHPVRIIFEFDDGSKYTLEGEELNTFMYYVDDGIGMLYIHGADMDKWNELMGKIYGRPITTDGSVVE